MSKRDKNYNGSTLEAFLICVVILGVSIGIYATGRTIGVDIGRNEITAREHYDTEKNGALAACTDTDITALRECVVQAVESAQYQSESRQDLYAQQDMSRWTFWMAIVSGLLFLVSSLGIVWIRDTLIETRRAVKAADDAVEVTRIIGQQQIRAYVGLKTINFNTHQVATVKIVNFGNTPAYKVQIRAHFYPKSLRGIVRLNRSHIGHPTTIHPDGISNTTCTPSAAILSRASSNNENVCVFIYIQYRDAFKVKRRTIYDIEISPISGGFEALPRKKGNCST